MTIRKRIAASRPDAPRIWLRVDKALVAKVLKAKRDLCVGESVRAIP